jgi:hypothetical protein
MDVLIFVGLALVVAIVAIDALARAARAPKVLPPQRNPSELVSTEKIVIDLSRR